MDLLEQSGHRHRIGKTCTIDIWSGGAPGTFGVVEFQLRCDGRFVVSGASRERVFPDAHAAVCVFVDWLLNGIPDCVHEPKMLRVFRKAPECEELRAYTKDNPPTDNWTPALAIEGAP